MCVTYAATSEDDALEIMVRDSRHHLSRQLDSDALTCARAEEEMVTLGLRPQPREEAIAIDVLRAWEKRNGDEVDE